MSETPQKPQKFHKTIFNTTEKSNFILNMTHDQFNKFAGTALAIGLLFIFVFSGIAEVIAINTTSIYSTPGSIQSDGIWNENNVNGFFGSLIFDWRILPAIGLAVAGLLGACIFIIAVIKQTLTKKQIFPCIAIAVMFIFMYISSLKSFSNIPNYSWFLGYRYGRYEGFLTYMSFMFVFLGGISITDKKAVKKVFDTVILIVFLQSIWSLAQIIGVSNFYNNIPLLGLNNLRLPSGSTGSPIFLAFFLSVGLIIACTGAIFDESSKRKAIYQIAVLPAAFLLVKTQTLMGFVSAAIILICMIIIAVAKKKKSEKFSVTPLALLLIGFVGSLIMIFINGFKLYDGAIIWQEGSKRIDAFGMLIKEELNVYNISEVYNFLWNKVSVFISDFPGFGLGPEGTAIVNINFQYDIQELDIKKDMTVDRPYNDYIFYMATFGIPFCIAFISTIIYSLIVAIKKVAKFISGKCIWTNFAAFTCVIVYVFISFINNSVASVAPFIWLMLGISCASYEKEK
ncbi:MAG: hypothetical protein E7510_06195 [Ruminococcus sp.]|nr:hypothetical protein [Ruminococcus sp.]